jgi:hypothetical protein
VDLKKQLLDRAVTAVDEPKQEDSGVRKESKRVTPERTIRHAFVRSQAFQVACRRRDFWAPTY